MSKAAQNLKAPPKYLETEPVRIICDKRVVAALLVKINLLALGGLQDILYFLIWAGGLPR